MTDVRFIVSWGEGTEFGDSWLSNTLYFAVDADGPPINYQDLADDLRDIYAARPWTSGSRIEVRAYNMDDTKPRPERAFSTVVRSGAMPAGPHQVALCLSYYSERNLPTQRGRIYLGPFTAPPRFPSNATIVDLENHARALAGLGGLNVDWSVYSPTRAQRGDDPTMSITNAWIDNSWDIQRRRKEPATGRSMIEVGE